MSAIIFNIIKYIFLIILYLILFILILLCIIIFSSITYKINILYKDKLKIHIKSGYILGLFNFYLIYDEKLEYKLNFIKFNILNSDKNDKNSNSDKEFKAEDNIKEDEAIEAEKEIKNISIDEKKISYKKIFKKNNRLNSGKNKKIRVIKLKQKLKQIFYKIENIIRNSQKILKKVIKKKIKIEKAFRDKRNIIAIKKIFKISRNIIKHILPNKKKGKCIFGMQDPATTANFVSYISLIPPKYYKKIEFIPVFEYNIIDIDLYMRGKIGLYYILYYIFILYFDKDIKRLYYLYKSRKLF